MDDCCEEVDVDGIAEEIIELVELGLEPGKSVVEDLVAELIVSVDTVVEDSS